MGPSTVEPVAGAEAWALARWATLREAQPVRPKQADLITLGQDWSLVLQTHPCTHHRGNRHYHDRLSQAGFTLVCVFSPVVSFLFKLEISDFMLVSRVYLTKLFSHLRRMVPSLPFQNTGIVPVQAAALYSPYFQQGF